jgi:hypothetical protein
MTAAALPPPRLRSRSPLPSSPPCSPPPIAAAQAPAAAPQRTITAIGRPPWLRLRREVEEPRSRNDAVPTLRERRDTGLHEMRRTFGRYVSPNVRLARHTPIRGGSRVAGGHAAPLPRGHRRGAQPRASFSH